MDVLNLPLSLSLSLSLSPLSLSLSLSLSNSVPGVPVLDVTILLPTCRQTRDQGLSRSVCMVLTWSSFTSVEASEDC